ncbi:MAG: single-stranded-DNA-specific exonuclease RecJ [Leptolyngbyaceae bacterium]|nr:single-stranded-DNA-specific exonuclease RecJ [Leptolyngbyaceae bacterium]
MVEASLNPMPNQFAEGITQLLTELFPGQDYGNGSYLAQILWQRGWFNEVNSPQEDGRVALKGFLQPDYYQPTSPFAFGEEMIGAVQRLCKAYEQDEKVAIWGDFDADGLTATAVLWDGLGQFFVKHEQLTYVIPNRLTESHGLNQVGLEQLAEQGFHLVVTCDTGSTSLDEFVYAQSLGLEVIVTDHHTLSPQRPAVVALINPRSLPSSHPLAHLSGVAVAYKLVEALYEALPDVPSEPLDHLLDLVAIGLIADLVELKGDCRYLAQRGIQQLQRLTQTKQPGRPGIAKLLEMCKRMGDRPTDISFGIGPRINAISRIHGDATFAVELLTSRDGDRCRQLAAETELANSRRKSLQKDVINQVEIRLAELDLATTQVIVLTDPQWSVGVLGLVAGQIAQEYGRPTILLTTDDNQNPKSTIQNALARGSARSINNIDLYGLVQSQSHLIHRFGGHPFAAGLSLPLENVPAFREAINRKCRELYGDLTRQSSLPTADLTVTVAELGRSLFRELKLVEPCGMGNPVPKLRVKNCTFKQSINRKIKDYKGNKQDYIKTSFRLCDHTCSDGFPGLWWGHYQDELPTQPTDVIVELDFNTYDNQYEVRLIALVSPLPSNLILTAPTAPIFIDQRPLERPRSEDRGMKSEDYFNFPPQPSTLNPQIAPTLQSCPRNWQELETWVNQAIRDDRTVAIAFSLPTPSPPPTILRHMVGIAKYLSRTGTPIKREKLAAILGIGDRSLTLGLTALSAVGFTLDPQTHPLKIGVSLPSDTPLPAIKTFLSAIQEEQFQQQYFAQAPIAVFAQASQAMHQAPSSLQINGAQSSR